MEITNLSADPLGKLHSWLPHVTTPTFANGAGQILTVGKNAMPQSSSHACSDSLTSEQIDALWKVHDPVEGEVKLKNAVAEYPGSVDELHTQIARSLGLQSRFGEAWDELSKISIVHSPLIEIRMQLEKGRLENSSGKRNDVKPYFLKALELARQEHLDFYAVDAAHMLGIVSEGQESIEWNKLALQLAANSKFKRAQNWKGSLLNNLGWTYFNIGDFDTASTIFDSALDFQKAAGDPVRIRVARWAVARCLRALKRYDEAFAIQNDLIQYPEQGYVSEELGELLLVMGRPDEARLRFKKTHELLSQSLGSDPSQASRLARLKQLSQ
jgi:tetratricopeptide (TPR) repeat protein